MKTSNTDFDISQISSFAKFHDLNILDYFDQIQKVNYRRISRIDSRKKYLEFFSTANF